MSRHVVATVEKLVTPALEELQLEVVEVEYKKEGSNYFLRVFIDKTDEGRVDLDDCARASGCISALLDEHDPVPGAEYILEVSSPGAERPLKKENDYQKSIGKNVFVSTYEPIDGTKAFEGVLKEVSVDYLTVDVQGKEIEIPRSKVAKARLAIVF
ncbi:ribosome maturation factor RimP [Thermoactinomyces sp. DSM 45891]|uniref:ribosome maturation factor RimP n=1 Tax=Thermoactinomyces sp. DSM 45891 TaxID=1761907 RepID=UPI00091F9ECD|nr:ribosome maturation factor RimP [Thermoactinomyces sp. DSM 45891]SFX35225.1 ribosome maturation factor RimP [Thermoactinomyces sp. DSM 45891]